MSGNSIYWYDLETFGSDPRRDRVAQFAGLRTDENLQPSGEPTVLYCRPGDDFLPDPVACSITGITPQQALEKGVPEAELAARILAEFAVPGTCVAGFNNIRFDDELVRRLLYRNLHDPYAREYRDGNSRWDILDMLRLCAAARPAGIQWPRREDDGQLSFRLEAVAEANGIEHSVPHDALSDVRATIAVAGLLRERQPRLYDYVWQLRRKEIVQRRLDLAGHKPVIHVSGRYSARRGSLTLAAPLCSLPGNRNAIVLYDLRVDPERWLSEVGEDLRLPERVAAGESTDDAPRHPLRLLHVNRCPVVAPVNVLDRETAGRWELDFAACQRHHTALLAAMKERRDFRQRVIDLFEGGPAASGDGGRAPAGSELVTAETDPDFMIYSGAFFSDKDRGLMDTVRDMRPEDLGRIDLPFADPRLPEMLFRYRARNYPQFLTAEEASRWREFCQSRVCGEDAWQGYSDSRAAAVARAEAADKETARKIAAIVKDVDDHVRALRERLGCGAAAA